MTIFRGFLLSYIRYGDNDAILNCFTDSNGYSSFFVKGIYAPKNKKKAYLFPLNELEISVNIPKQGVMNRASSINLMTSFYNEKDLNQNCVLMFSSEFLNQVLKNENRNPTIYSEINLFLNHLSDKNFNAHIQLVFNFLKFNGLVPLSSSFPFLNPESGNFESQKIHYLFDEKTSEIWKKYSIEGEIYSITLSRSERNLFLESLMMYYTFHIDHFRIPNSLEILRQVFE